MSARVLRVVMNVNMNNSHDGLRRILDQEAKIDVRNLAPGELVMCVNKRGDKMKTIGTYGLVVGYLKMPKGERIMMEALKYIPMTFGAPGGFDYDKAVRAALREKFKLKIKQNSPLQTARAIDRFKATFRELSQR